MQNTGEDSQQSRMKRLLEEGKFYEYSQKVLIHAKRDLSRRNYEAAYRLACEGAYELLTREQFESAEPLAEIMVEAVKGYKPDVQTIASIFAKLPAPYKHKFIINILRILPDDALLATYASDLEREGDYGKALVIYIQVYWTATGSLQNILRNLSRLLSACHPEEEDLLILRTALHLMGFKNLDTASRLLSAFPSISGPLIHFGTFLIQALSITDSTLVNILKERYQPSLARDPMLEEYIAQIEKVYFGVERESGRAGLLSLLTG